MTKSVKLLAVMLGSLAVTMFLFRHDNSDPTVWSSVVFVALLIYLPFGIPAVRAFIVARPRTVFRTGVGLAVGGFVGIFVLAFTSAFYHVPTKAGASDPISMVVLWAMMGGIALAILPRSMAALKRTETSDGVPQHTQEVHNSYDGVREGWAAIALVVRNWVPFVRLVGPWIVLLWAVPLVGLHIAAILTGTAHGFLDAPVGKVSAATALFAERLPYTLASALAFPIALVAWHRYIITGETRSFAPLCVTARYLWRLWALGLMFSLLARLVATNSPDLAHFLGTTDKRLVSELLYWSLLALGAYRGSAFALVFAAVAMGNRDFTATDSARLTKPLGSSFALGFVFSLLPFGALWWVGIEVVRRDGIMGPSSPVSEYALWLLPVAAMFIALASCATYLSRNYVALLTPKADASCRMVLG